MSDTIELRGVTTSATYHTFSGTLFARQLRVPAAALEAAARVLFGDRPPVRVSCALERYAAVRRTG